MRPTLSAMLAGFAVAVAPLAALAQPRAAPVTPGQPMPRLVIGAPGRCEMTTAGRTMPCTSGLIYVQHVNGTILVSVQSGPDVTIGFEGDSDRQPRPEEYSLHLTRLHSSVSGRTAAKGVTGSCEISMSNDGRTWHRATCRAADGNGMVTEVRFTGNGQPVTAARPGQEGPPAAGARPNAAPAAPASPPKS
jgi:hypothetical protein